MLPTLLLYPLTINKVYNLTIPFYLKGISMKRPLASTGILLSLLCASGTLTANTLDAALPAAHIGIDIIDANTQATVYQENAAQYFTPASNTKLFTATAALLELGANYQYHTQIGTASDGNIYLTFSGDPSLTKANLVALVQTLKTHGITTINGNIVLDTSVYSPPWYAIGVSQDDKNTYYGAPAKSIIINQNAVWVTLNTDQGKTVATSNNPDFTIMNHLIMANTEQLKTCVYQPYVNAHQQIVLNGCLPFQKSWTIGLAISHPTAYAKVVIRQALTQAHISLRGKIIVGKAPANFKMIADHTSAPLSSLLQTMLTDSNNIYAASLTSTLGKKMYGVGNSKAGSNAILAILKAHGVTHLPLLEDGDGGSMQNMITPAQLIELLDYIYHSPALAKVIVPGLPIAGETGTLANRMTTPPLKGNVRAKTGSITYISALSGYLYLPPHRVLIFSILVNGAPQPLSEIRNAEDQFLLTAVSHNMSTPIN